MTSKRPQGLRSGQRARKSGSWDNIQVLRDELQDLATYLMQSPPRRLILVLLSALLQSRSGIIEYNSRVPCLDVVPEIRPTGPCAAPMKTSNQSFQLENPPLLQQAP